MKNGVNPAAKSNGAILQACKNGDVNIVKKLLADPRVNPSVNKFAALESAITKNSVEIIKLLKEDSRFDPKAYEAHLKSLEQPIPAEEQPPKPDEQ